MITFQEYLKAFKVLKTALMGALGLTTASLSYFNSVGPPNEHIAAWSLAAIVATLFLAYVLGGLFAGWQRAMSIICVISVLLAITAGMVYGEWYRRYVYEMEIGGAHPRRVRVVVAGEDCYTPYARAEIDSYMHEQNRSAPLTKSKVLEMFTLANVNDIFLEDCLLAARNRLVYSYLMMVGGLSLCFCFFAYRDALAEKNARH